MGHSISGSMQKEIYKGKRKKREKERGVRWRVESTTRTRKKHGTQSKIEARCLGLRQHHLALHILPCGNWCKGIRETWWVFDDS